MEITEWLFESISSAYHEMLFISTQDLEERLAEIREKESATKEENSNLYQQLQEVPFYHVFIYTI